MLSSTDLPRTFRINVDARRGTTDKIVGTRIVGIMIGKESLWPDETDLIDVFRRSQQAHVSTLRLD